jgi:hypothetical protein
MKELWSILKATLRAAAWKIAPGPPSVTLRSVFICTVVLMVTEAARQYFAIDDAAAFSIYGVNTIIAETAVLAAVALLFFSVDRTAALAQLFALVALADGITIVAISMPALAAASGLVAAGLVYFSRNRTAVISELFALAILAELMAIAVARLPAFQRLELMAGMWTPVGATVSLMIGLLVWLTGAVTAIFRSSISSYERPFVRALGLTSLSMIAMVASPAFPVFMDRDADPSSYNVWEWARAKSRTAEPELKPRINVAAVELSQPSLLEAEVNKLLPERKGTADIYAIGIAGWSDQDVFVKELNGGLAALDQAIGLDRGTVRLVNHADTTETLPVANRTNFASVVHSVAKIMDKNEDVLLIFITSHGGPTGVGLRLEGEFALLSPDHIATVLDREGIKNRLLIVSACYSGVFVKRLASPDTVVLTAADADNPSFGCSNERDWTYFGDALFNQNLGAGVSLEHAFKKAKAKISEWEARDKLPASNPQAFFGSSLSKTLHEKLGSGDAHRALADERRPGP